MGLYASPHFRVGHMGVCGYRLQTAQKVAPDAIADPAVDAGAFTLLGPCPYPGWDEAQNFIDIESSASLGRDLGTVPGRREHTVRNTIQIADGSYFASSNATLIRNRTAPATAGLYKGLQLTTLKFGVDALYSDEDFARESVDCLLNTVSFAFTEGQPLSATCEWWPMAVLENETTGITTAGVPNGDVLAWKDLSITVGGTDYHNIQARVTCQITNNLQRIGTRQQLVSAGSELAISRTPYSIIPGLEKVTLSFEWHDKPPVALRSIKDWTAITLLAQHPDFAFYGSTRRYFQIVITRSHLARISQPEIPANQPFSWSGDMKAIGVAITAGTI